MEGPSLVRLLRKRNEQPVDTLFLQRPAPHSNAAGEGGSKVEQSGPTTYIRQVKRKQEPEENDGNAKKRQLRAQDFHGDATTAINELGQGLTQPAKATPRKEFTLKHPSSSSSATQTRTPRKRKQEDNVATFVERPDPKKHRHHGSNASTQQHEYSADLNPDPEIPQDRPFKRPGKASAVKHKDGMDIDAPQPKHETPIESQRRKIEALADEMHAFALDELAKTPKPVVTSRPKLPPARSRARHQALASTTSVTHSPAPDVDVDMDSDSEYVYDTYVLATPSPSKPGSTSDDAADVLRVRDVEGNVGYLVITEADEEAWETYMDEHDASDPEGPDEEDENAEDYYGADYPSDELASDDEYDRGAYGYRARKGSDDELYDEDTGDWSDGFEDQDGVEGNYRRFLAERRAGGSGDGE